MNWHIWMPQGTVPKYSGSAFRPFRAKKMNRNKKKNQLICSLFQWQIHAVHQLPTKLVICTLAKAIKRRLYVFTSLHVEPFCRRHCNDVHDILNTINFDAETNLQQQNEAHLDKWLGVFMFLDYFCACTMRRRWRRRTNSNYRHSFDFSVRLQLPTRP